MLKDIYHNFKATLKGQNKSPVSLKILYRWDLIWSMDAFLYQSKRTDKSPNSRSSTLKFDFYYDNFFAKTLFERDSISQIN